MYLNIDACESDIQTKIAARFRLNVRTRHRLFRFANLNIPPIPDGLDNKNIFDENRLSNVFSVTFKFLTSESSPD